MKKAPENDSKIIDRLCNNIQTNWNFGPKRSHHLHKIPFSITNPSKTLPLYLSFSDCIFHFHPQELTLKPKKSATIHIYFYFCEAKIIVGKVEMCVNGHLEKVIKLSAIGKIPFLKLTKSTVNFGEVNLLKTKTDKIEVKNLSEVSVGFRIRRKSKQVLWSEDQKDFKSSEMSSKKRDYESHILVSPQKGFLNPKESYQITIQYSPTIFDKHDFEEYVIEMEENYLSEDERVIKGLCVQRWNQVAAKIKAKKLNINIRDTLQSKEYFYDLKDMQKIAEKNENFTITNNGKGF